MCAARCVQGAFQFLCYILWLLDSVSNQYTDKPYPDISYPANDLTLVAIMRTLSSFVLATYRISS